MVLRHLGAGHKKHHRSSVDTKTGKILSVENEAPEQHGEEAAADRKTERETAGGSNTQNISPGRSMRSHPLCACSKDDPIES